MNMAEMLVPLLFLMFLMIYQAAPDQYQGIISETFNGIEESFEEQYKTSYEIHEASLRTVIFLFLKAALYSILAVAIIVVWLASIIPFDAETLIWLYIVLMIISSIPWSLLLGVGLMINDKIKRRKM